MTTEKNYIQAVISASRELSALGKEAIRDKIVAEIREILPAAKEANLVHCRVVTERSATYSILPGVDDIRPSPATPIGNLFLAGDYVQTRWPATMEGAVRSGRLAAEAILAAVGRPEALVDARASDRAIFGLALAASIPDCQDEDARR